MDPRIKGASQRQEAPSVVKGIFTADWKDTELLRTFLSRRDRIRAHRVPRLTVRQQPSGDDRDPHTPG